MSESGFQMTSASMWTFDEKSEKHPQRVGEEKADNITVACCTGADGFLMNPFVIFPGKRLSFRPQDDFPAATFKKTKHG